MYINVDVVIQAYLVYNFFCGEHVRYNISTDTVTTY